MTTPAPITPPEVPDIVAIPLPGDQVALVPLAVLRQYVSERKLSHPQETPQDDVTAHNMTVDTATGSSVWHLEWELGPCDYTDENGFPQHGYVYHRHPLGNEYTEIFQK